MNYERIQARELDAGLVQSWAAIRAADPDLASPYFSPAFTQAVAAVRNDVEVCIIRDGERVVGFLPFHRRPGRVGRPVGLGLSDYHGVIAESGAEWSLEPLLRACRLVRFEFDHVLAGQSQFGRYTSAVAESPIIEVGEGYERYLEQRDRASRKQIKELERKRAKFEEACGPIRFELHTPEPARLEALMEWKSEQCRSTGVVEFFALEWTRELLRQLQQSADPELKGQVSCLYAGERLAAAHFAMRTPRIWHSWFPTYDREFAAWSPGGILLLEMIKAAAAEGARHIDLGKGVSTYKRQFMSGSIMVAEGAVTVPSVRNRLRDAKLRLEAWGRTSTLRPLLRVPGQILARRERRERYA